MSDRCPFGYLFVLLNNFMITCIKLIFSNRTDFSLIVSFLFLALFSIISFFFFLSFFASVQKIKFITVLFSYILFPILMKVHVYFNKLINYFYNTLRSFWNNNGCYSRECMHFICFVYSMFINTCS